MSLDNTPRELDNVWVVDHQQWMLGNSQHRPTQAFPRGNRLNRRVAECHHLSTNLKEMGVPRHETKPYSSYRPHSHLIVQHCSVQVVYIKTQGALHHGYGDRWRKHCTDREGLR